MPHNYGLISDVDANALEKTIDLILADFPHAQEISVTEIGLFNCQTAVGVRGYILSKGYQVNYTGIDNERDKPIEAPEWMNFIKGDSNIVYNKLKDYSQHLIIVDGLHTYYGVIQDFFCYMDKVHYDGFICFHDTGEHLVKTDGWQGVGDKSDPDFCLGGVRKALKKIGLLNNKFMGWRLIFDDADVNDTGGGLCCFKKI